MVRLAFNIGVVDRLGGQSTLSIPISLEEELRFSSHIPSDVLLFGTTEEALPRYCALARFTRIGGDATTARNAVLENVRWFGTQVSRGRNSSPGQVIYQIFDDAFETVINEGRAISYGSFAEDLGNFDPSPTPGAEIFSAINRQVVALHRATCQFSGEPVTAGPDCVFPIISRQQGALLRVCSFLLLMPDIGVHYTKFGWTIGPDLQIISDSWRIGQDQFRINPSGRLITPEDMSWGPDQNLLALHRKEFFARLS